MCKEAFIEAHEQLIDEWLSAHFPDGNWTTADEQRAYDATADLAHGRMVDNVSARADFLNDQRKEGQN